MQRNNRRRSRQCRGPRARNYIRAIDRATADSNKASAEQVQAIVDDAEETGAMAAFNRQRAARDKAAREGEQQ